MRAYRYLQEAELEHRLSFDREAEGHYGCGTREYRDIRPSIRGRNVVGQVAGLFAKDR